MSVDESNGTEAEKDNSDGKPGYLFDVAACKKNPHTFLIWKILMILKSGTLDLLNHMLKEYIIFLMKVHKCLLNKHHLQFGRFFTRPDMFCLYPDAYYLV